MIMNRCECGGPATTIHYDGEGRKCMPTRLMDGTEIKWRWGSDGIVLKIAPAREFDVDGDKER